jgi:3',5'-cyclic AMP phosphodiesterase CpdA
MSTIMQDDWVLAHFSDPHLTRLDGLRATDLMSKRLLGYLSWWRRRRHTHRPEVLDALISDIESIGPDHIAITGDLTHLGTAPEFEEAAAWLRRVGTPQQVTVVPGNHDAYVAEPWAQTFSLWSSYMASDGETPKQGGDAVAMFPSVRVRGCVALIGVSSAVPSSPLLATGRIGRHQLEALSQVLSRTGAAGLFRILLLHHPAVPGSIRWRKRLIDAEALASVIAQQGVELVLHGHAHRSSLGWLPTPSGRAPAVGVCSASEFSEHAPRRAQYHLYRIRMQPGAPRVTMSKRRYCQHQGAFIAVDDDHAIA